MPICNVCSHDVSADRDRVWVVDGFDIVRCPNCSLVFRADLPTYEELGEIYDVSYFVDSPGESSRHGYADYRADQSHHRRNARRRLERLEQEVARQGRLLDVGAAAGFFVDEAARRGWSAQGVDVSEEMAGWARANLGLDVVTGTLWDLDEASEAFTAVTMWDYIEHSVDPRAELEKSYDLLAPGGILALSTGDVSSLVARVSGRRWHLLTPRHHNFYFSERTLAFLLADLGFESVSFSRPATLYSVQHLVYKLETLIGGRWPRRVAARLGESRAAEVGVPLNLFDIVTVTARKR